MIFSQSRRRTLAVSIALAALVGTGLYVRHKAGPKHLATVTPGVLYRSGLLRPGNLENVIHRKGVKTIVSLLPPCAEGAADASEACRRLASEARIARARNVRYETIAMEAGTPPTEAQVSAWVALLADETNHPILVHCKAGVVRTGMMVAVYESEFLGKDNAEILDGLPMWRHDVHTSEKHAPVREFILGYQPRFLRRFRSAVAQPSVGRP